MKLTNCKMDDLKKYNSGTGVIQAEATGMGMKKIAVLVSGGVDSSVALALLKKQGHDVTAFYLKIWLEDDLAFLGECPWQDDLSYVQQVCDQLAVPLQIMNLQREYHERVVAYTLAQVKAGKTPNPDILCNQFIKFGLFLDQIDDSFEKVATGHYAQVFQTPTGYILECSPDPVKDQTYFLSRLNQTQLARCLFPIGHLYKTAVRALAQEFNLPNKDRKDSQGICFLGKFKFRDFIKHHLGTKSGDLVEYETGSIVGRHEGFWFYTIGQRQGIGLAGGPWYVIAKDPDKNIVFISRRYYESQKDRTQVLVRECRWLSGVQPTDEILQIKLRHGAHKHHAQVIFFEDNNAQALLRENDQGIAAGQFAVFYQKNQCLGSGIIAY